MIPEVNLDQVQEPEYSNDTFHIDFTNGRIGGIIGGIASVEQAIYVALMTERYAYMIYSWQYGVGIEKYIGKDFGYIKADIGREIRETLMQDDRIIDVYDFDIKKINIDSAIIEFSCLTTEGNVNIKQEVSL